MPSVRIPWAIQGPSYLPIRINSSSPPNSLRPRTRLLVSSGLPESRISPSLIDYLGMQPMGSTETTWFGSRNNIELPFYLIDVRVTLGLMGMLTEDITLRKIMVVAGEEFGHYPGIMIGSDLIRRGRLLLDGDGISFCL